MTAFKQPELREYYWTVEASGYIDATSLEEAKEIVGTEADGLVSDDRKYWTIKVIDEESEAEHEAYQKEYIKHGRAE